MEHVRSSVQEHCEAIQRIIREENEHWREIHLAIDQYVGKELNHCPLSSFYRNLITSADFHPREQSQSLVPNVPTTDEVEEDEQDASNLVVRSPVSDQN